MTPRQDASARTLKYAQKSEALLAAAALLFNQRGVKGATLADVAAHVGLVKNSVTYYYRKKEDLASACFLRAIEDHHRFIDRAAAQTSVAERVSTLFQQQAMRLAAIEAGTQPALMQFHDLRALPQPQIAQVFAAYTDMFRRVRDLLRSPENTALSRPACNARGHLLLSALNNLRAWLQRHEPHEYGRVAERAADILLRGMAGPASAWHTHGAEQPWVLGSDTDMAPGSFLRSATELINEQGYRGASVHRIAERLHLTKGAFYARHDAKDDLVMLCFERSFEIMRQALTLSQSAPGTAWEQLCAVTRGLVRLQLSDGGPLLRLTAISALPDPVQRARIRETTGRLTERLASQIVEGVMQGTVRPLDASLAAQIALCGINAAAELQRWSADASADNVAALYAKPLLLGLLQQD